MEVLEEREVLEAVGAQVKSVLAEKVRMSGLNFVVQCIRTYYMPAHSETGGGGGTGGRGGGGGGGSGGASIGVVVVRCFTTCPTGASLVTQNSIAAGAGGSGGTGGVGGTTGRSGVQGVSSRTRVFT